METKMNKTAYALKTYRIPGSVGEYAQGAMKWCPWWLVQGHTHTDTHKETDTTENITSSANAGGKSIHEINLIQI